MFNIIMSLFGLVFCYCFKVICDSFLKYDFFGCSRTISSKIFDNLGEFFDVGNLDSEEF